MFLGMPPNLTGDARADNAALRDYLFKLAQSLETVASGLTAVQASMKVTTRKDGQQVIKTGGEYSGDIEAVRKNAEELKSLIVKSAKNLEKEMDAGDRELAGLIESGDSELASRIVNGDDAVVSLMDSKEEAYNGKYLARSEFGTFEQNLDARFQTAATGVIESYNYSERISSMQDSISLLQEYNTNLDGQIRRGIVWDPTAQQYVTGLAISQNLVFSGVCDGNDPNNPHDGYTDYYLQGEQTFGLYTSSGWQFWIGGEKRGWFSSLDGMLHVANIIVENTMQVSDSWQIRSSPDGSEFEILYVGE